MNLGESCGDIYIELDSKVLLIEWKEVPSDFVASITDRRLFTQAEGMRRITPYAFLLLSDNFHYSRDGHLLLRGRDGYGPHPTWTYAHINGALTRAQAQGLIVRTAEFGVVNELRLIMQWGDQEEHGSITRDVVLLDPLDEHEQDAVNLLSLFPGIGVIQAEKFLDWTGKKSLAETLVAATSPLPKDNKPSGWTNGTVERVRQHLGLKPNQRLKILSVEEWKEVLD